MYEPREVACAIGLRERRRAASLRTQNWQSSEERRCRRRRRRVVMFARYRGHAPCERVCMYVRVCVYVYVCTCMCVSANCDSPFLRTCHSPHSCLSLSHGIAFQYLVPCALAGASDKERRRQSCVTRRERERKSGRRRGIKS